MTLRRFPSRPRTGRERKSGAKLEWGGNELSLPQEIYGSHLSEPRSGPSVGHLFRVDRSRPRWHRTGRFEAKSASVLGGCGCGCGCGCGLASNNIDSNFVWQSAAMSLTMLLFQFTSVASVCSSARLKPINWSGQARAGAIAGPGSGPIRPRARLDRAPAVGQIWRPQLAERPHLAARGAASIGWPTDRNKWPRAGPHWQ